jgi:hypothetical protein
MDSKKNVRRTQTAKAPGIEQSVRRPSRRIFERLRGWERQHKGQIAAIDMESEEIFLGKDLVEATLNGWKKYPGRPFYFVRIGYPVVHSRHGGLRKQGSVDRIRGAQGGSRERLR